MTHGITTQTQTLITGTVQPITIERSVAKCRPMIFGGAVSCRLCRRKFDSLFGLNTHRAIMHKRGA